MKKILNKLELSSLLLLALTLGLAPFNPPHVWEKLVMLFSGTLTKPLDFFDLCMHGLPWVLVIAKIALIFKEKRANTTE